MKTKFPESKVPEAYLTPISREIPQYSPPEGSREFSYHGLKFRAPERQITDIQERPGAVLLKFPMGKTIAIIKGSEPGGLMEPLLGDKPEEAKRIKAFFGEQILESNYIFYKSILESHPDQITIFMPQKEATARSVLVILKAILTSSVGKGSKVIYSFATDNIKGFQFGSPDETNRVYIEFFDSQDQQYGIIIENMDQYEIDFILSTIKTL